MDNPEIIHIPSDIKGVTVKENSLTFSGFANKYINDNNEIIIDRAGDVVPPYSYDLANYAKSGIILLNHNYDKPIGKISTISAVPEGLEVEGTIYSALMSKLQDSYKAIELGVINQMSIGYRLKDYTWELVAKSAEVDNEAEGVWACVFKDVEITEISIVTVPANADSLITVGSVDSKSLAILPRVNEKSLKSLHKAAGEVRDSNLVEAIENLVDFTKGNFKRIEELIKGVQKKSESPPIGEDKKTLLQVDNDVLDGISAIENIFKGSE